MKCGFCSKDIDNEWREIRGGLRNDCLAIMCPKCYDEYVKYSSEQIRDRIKK